MGDEKSKMKKESSLTKYSNINGGRFHAFDLVGDYNVNMSNLFLGTRFAHGANSRLYHGLCEDEPVAVKIVSVPDDEMTKTKRWLLDWRANSQAKSRFYLRKLVHKAVSLAKLTKIALEIARGMEYVHSQGIVHCNLKPENVIINRDFDLKLTNFGMAYEEAYCGLLADNPRTYRWMAPEMITGKSYRRKIDVYSFGLILWELVAGMIPFEDMNPIQAAFAVVNKNLRPSIPGDYAPAMRALIEQCWSMQPVKRPEFWQIVKVLKKFESSLAHDGTLDLVQMPVCQDHKKGLLHWIHKLGLKNSRSC